MTTLYVKNTIFHLVVYVHYYFLYFISKKSNAYIIKIMNSFC